MNETEKKDASVRESRPIERSFPAKLSISLPPTSLPSHSHPSLYVQTMSAKKGDKRTSCFLTSHCAY